MDAKDLMIGDWVKISHRNKIGKVYRIDIANGSGNGWAAVIDGDWHESFLEPIPLTTKILEANGFMLDDCCDYAQKYVCPVEIDNIPQTILEFTFYEGISADTLFKCWTKPKSCDGENSVHICDLKYVHELQHALRLCGIKKEITL